MATRDGGRWWKLTLYRAVGGEAEKTAAICRAPSVDEARRQIAGMFEQGWVMVDAREGMSYADLLGDAAASRKQLSTKRWEQFSLAAARRRANGGGKGSG